MNDNKIDEELNTEQHEALNEEQLKAQLAQRDKRTKVICLIVTIVVIALLIIIIAVAASEKESDHCHNGDCDNKP
jgi:t-SNARE complex subunit (syntaxin)